MTISKWWHAIYNINLQNTCWLHHRWCNVQAYLLEGLSRWNAARTLEALDIQKSGIRSFDAKLQDRANKLSVEVFGLPVCPNYNPPAPYTGELIGISYLFNQTGQMMPRDANELEKDIDKGFEQDLQEDPDEEAVGMNFNIEQVPVDVPVVDSNSDTDSAATEEYVSEVNFICSNVFIFVTGYWKLLWY